MSEQAAFDERVYERKPVLRRWLFVHKWSSLICTLFLLLICITGLPLVLREEINGLLDDALPYAQVPEGTPNISLDRVVEASRKMHPGETIISVFVDDDEPRIMVYMASSWAAFNANRKSLYSIRFDAHTGDVLKQTKPFGADGLTFLQLMLTLHRDLFMGLPGELFLGAMALLFVAAIVSGIAVYGPFMRKLDFGTVRAARSRRLKWLDVHNLLGVVTLGWALVVGATGVINELSTPLFALWQQTDVRAMLAPLQGKPVPQARDHLGAGRLRHGESGFPGHDHHQHRVSGLAVWLALSLCGLDQGQGAADLAPVQPGAGRRQKRGAGIRGHHALVSARAGALAPPAFRRLWRHAAEDHLGDAGPRDDLRARQRAVSRACAIAGHEAEPLCGCDAAAIAGRCRMTGRRSFALIWRWPALLAVLSVFGLLAALIGQTGIWLPLSWSALTIPLAVAAVCIVRSRD